MSKKLLAAVLALTLLTGMGFTVSAAPCPACGAVVQDVINFENGLYGFIAVDTAPIDADDAELSIVRILGRHALMVTNTTGGVPYVAIDADSLLGDRIMDLRRIEMTVGVTHDDGEFYAVSGRIYAYSGEERHEWSGPWSVFLPRVNPNIAAIDLDREERLMVPGHHNMFVVTLEVDNGRERAGPATMYITDIKFLDANGDLLPVVVSAEFNPPVGFGRPDLSNLFAVFNEQILEGATGSSGAWGQAVRMDAVKNDGTFDPELVLAEDAIITVAFSGAYPPNLILQSWTEGAPEGSGWAQVAHFAMNDSGTLVQFRYEDIVEAFGGDDFTYLDVFYVGATSGDVTVTGVTFGTSDFETPADEVREDWSNLVSKVDVIDFEVTGSTGPWGQAVEIDTFKNYGDFDPDWLVPGVIVTVFFTSADEPEVVLQSWSGGTGWAKVAPFAINGSFNGAQFNFDDMVAAFGDDFSYLDRFIVGATESDITIHRVLIGMTR